MLDYFGSIHYTDDQLKKDIYSNFKDYSKELLNDIFDDLKKEQIIKGPYTYSGWSVFHQRPIFLEFKTRIQKKTEQSYIRFLLSKLVECDKLPEELGIIQLIESHYSSIKYCINLNNS